MNATLFNQVTNFDVPTIDQDIVALPKISFKEVLIGEHFLRSAKDGHNQIFLKIGKRNALLMIDSKGSDSKVLKFKEENKVIPLDTDLKLTVSKLTEMGRMEVARKIVNTQRINVLRTTVQASALNAQAATEIFPYPSERRTSPDRVLASSHPMNQRDDSRVIITG